MLLTRLRAGCPLIKLGTRQVRIAYWLNDHKLPQRGTKFSICRASADDSLDGGFCIPANVTIDNEEHPRFTKLQVEIPDYPGLLRIVSWVLNGLELRVENAELLTEDDVACNTFYITDYIGQKLDDEEAEMLQQRLTDTINICIPADGLLPNDASCDYTLRSGPYTIHNSCAEKATEIVVQGSETSDNGSLLELASVLTGVGLSVKKGVIQSCSDCEVPISDPHFNTNAKGRLFRFFVQDAKGVALDSGRASALLYTLRMLRKQSFQPLTPPGKGSYY